MTLNKPTQPKISHITWWKYHTVSALAWWKYHTVSEQEWAPIGFFTDFPTHLFNAACLCSMSESEYWTDNQGK